jgi:hypothetical protein
MESLGYVLLYFFFGRLPWESTHDNNTIKQMKINIIENTQIPIVFYKYFSYVKQLGFIETPNYNMLRSLFITELSKNIKN